MRCALLFVATLAMAQPVFRSDTRAVDAVSTNFNRGRVLQFRE